MYILILLCMALSIESSYMYIYIYIQSLQKVNFEFKMLPIIYAFILQIAIFAIRKAGLYAMYVLLLLLMAYLLNQLDRYCLAICTEPMAQEIGYGDKSCLALTNVSKDILPDISTCTSINNSTE